MIGKPKELIPWLLDQDQEKRFEAKEYFPKRSRNANSYFWCLVTEIANVMRVDKEVVYLDMLRHYGQSEIVSVLADIDVRGFFPYYDEVGTGTVNGKKFRHYKIYKGSSEYDSREMAILIDGTILEAEQLGIQTLTPRELEKLKGYGRERRETD